MATDVGQYTCRDIHSVAAVETTGTYEGNVEFYEEHDFGYVPLPAEGKYFDVAAGGLEALSDEQFVDVDAPALRGLEKLLEHPFVLTRDAPSYGYEVENGELRMVSPVEGMNVHDVAREHPDHLDAAMDYEEGKRWGIITLADANRHTARAALYPYFAELEQRFARQVKSHFTDRSELFERTGEDVRERWKDARAADVELHPSELMKLYELEEVVCDTDDLRRAWGFDSKNSFSDYFGGPVSQRNDIMHPTRTLVRNREELESLLDRVRRLERVLRTSDAGRPDRPDFPV